MMDTEAKAQAEHEDWVRQQDEDRIAELEAEVERLENLVATGVHSCSPHCKRPLCVLRRENRELREALEKIANQAHHGGLLDGDAYCEIRRLSLPYWNKEECDRLQKADIEKYDREILAEDIRREREDGRE